jgi:uncharacterized protein YjbI with pentapeptide repeats
MTQDEIKAMLDSHAKWRRGESGGAWADLAGANLAGADLAGANLVWANLTGANLAGANLARADLTGACLIGANLAGANLARANLAGANLAGANLARADLTGADLVWANLTGANLAGANLARANLGGASLRDADLSGANLRDASLGGAYARDANLGGADLRGATISPLAAARLEILPREGEVIGWKRCSLGVLVKVRVPPDARRSNATGRKCRAERVEVLDVVGGEAGESMRNVKTIYRTGETVACHEWCDDRWQECAGGIHFYLTREEAEVHL